MYYSLPDKSMDKKQGEVLQTGFTWKNRKEESENGRGLYQMGG